MAASDATIVDAGGRDLPFEGTPVLSDEEFERASEEIAGIAQGDGALAYA